MKIIKRLRGGLKKGLEKDSKRLGGGLDEAWRRIERGLEENWKRLGGELKEAWRRIGRGL